MSTAITCQRCGGTRGEHVGFNCPEDPTRPPPLAALAVLPAPLCELCGVPFNPNVGSQTCRGQPCLVPENEIIDWVVRVRATPTAAAPLGRWPSKQATDSLLAEQALRLAEIALALARDLGVALVPQVGPYCPTDRRAVPALALETRELEMMQQAWHFPESLHRFEPKQLAELDAVWARVAKHMLETVCHRLQAEFR